MGIQTESYSSLLLLSWVYYTTQRFHPPEITGGGWCLDAVFDPISVWLIIMPLSLKRVNMEHSNAHQPECQGSLFEGRIPRRQM